MEQQLVLWQTMSFEFLQNQQPLTYYYGSVCV